MSTLKQLIECEISDFFAGLGHPGEPETPEEMQSQLLARIAPLLASMEQEPIILYRERNPVTGMTTGWVELTQEEYGFIKDHSSEDADFKRVYAAPQLPQPAVPECYQRLLHHAYGMTMGHDWNKGTMAGHHREKLCKAVEDCRAAMLNRQRVDNVDGVPPTTIKPVPDLYEVTVPSGRSTTFTKDAAEAKDCADMGWKVQEYVRLERYQEVMLQGNHRDLSYPVDPQVAAYEKIMQQAVPDEAEMPSGPGVPEYNVGWANGWNSCREEMLQGAEQSKIDMLCKVLKNAPLSPSDSQGRKKADVENDSQQFESLSRGKK